MKIVIAGGAGQVGTILARAFRKSGSEVIVLSRNPMQSESRVVRWDAETIGDWTNELEAADVVINLAGRSVNCRYTPQNRRLILESRVKSTQVIGTAISKASRPPRVWLQASTATIYSHRFDAPNDETTGIIGGSETDVPEHWRFSVEVAQAWERAAQDSPTPQTRKVILRSVMIMSPDSGGIFDTLLRLVRFGLGGRVAGGQQFVSWIHDQDFVNAIFSLIDNDTMEGIVNVASPNPIPYSEFMRTLRKELGVPIGLPATKWMLEIGALFLQTESELVLKSRRVIPGRLLESGFTFLFPTWVQAAQDLCQRWRASR